MPARTGAVPQLTHQRRGLALILGVTLAVEGHRLPALTLLALGLALLWSTTRGATLRWWLTGAVVTGAALSAHSGGSSALDAAALCALLVLKLVEARSDTELLLVAVLLPLPVILLAPGTITSLMGIAAVLGACAFILRPMPSYRTLLPALWVLVVALLVGAAGAWLPRRPGAAAAGSAPVVPESSFTLGAGTTWPDADTVAFRARFQGPRPARAQRYWRMAVLNATDGRRWWSAPEPRRSAPRGGRRAHYAYEIQRVAGPWATLVTLDAPLFAGGRNAAPNGVITGAERLYYARSGGALTQAPGPLDWATPPTSRAVRALASRLRLHAGGGAGARASAVLAWLRAHHFQYTRAPQLGRRDPLDRFLFHTRAGYCQDYAAAFVTLMRLEHVPARLIVGYYGGRYQARTGSIAVRARDAHAWAEIWSAQRGWIRVDPTAAATPDLAHQARAWLRRFLHRRPTGWAWLWALLPLTLGLALRARRRDPYVALYATLGRLGVRRQPGEGHLAFARRIGHTHPALADAMERAARLHVSARYGAARVSFSARRRAARAVRALLPPAPRTAPGAHPPT